MEMGRTAVNVFGNTVAVRLVQRLGGFELTANDPAIEGASARIMAAQ
jgi:Na+/H+-dicarboxylate symporter